MPAKLFQALSSLPLVPGLSQKARTQRQLLVYQGTLMACGGLLWGSLCLFFGLTIAGIIPFGYTLLTIVNFAILGAYKRFKVARFFQVLISLLLPVFFQIAIGGFFASGAVSLWSLLSLVSSITFQSVRAALVWTGFYLLLIFGLGALDSRLDPLIPPAFAPMLFVVNIATISSMVVALILYFVTSRDRANEELEAARRETETILKEVQEGLLLLDREGRISAGYSASAQSLLGLSTPTGVAFPEFIGRVSDVPASTIADFILLILNKNLKQKKIDFLNPLVRVRMGGNGFRFLAFQFRPIHDAQGGVTQIFVTVRDISEEVNLEQKIKQEEEKSRKRIELISQILYSRPALVRTFLKDTASELESIDRYLNECETGVDFFKVVEVLYRGVHSVKGNAALIRLEYFVAICHRIEEYLSDLRKRATISGLDLFEPVGDLDNLKRAVSELEELFQSLEQFSETDAMVSEIQMLRDSLVDLAQTVARQEGKEVALEFNGTLDASRTSLKSLRTILVQLIRNAVVHGLERPEERIARGKPDRGTVRVNLAEGPQGLTVQVDDDGGGIDLDRVRFRLSEQGQDTSNLTDRGLLPFLFAPGFSTRESADRNAGRGVGLNILKEEVKKLGGRLRVRNNPGRGAAFIISLNRLDSARV